MGIRMAREFTPQQWGSGKGLRRKLSTYRVEGADGRVYGYTDDVVYAKAFEYGINKAQGVGARVFPS